MFPPARSLRSQDGVCHTILGTYFRVRKMSSFQKPQQCQNISENTLWRKGNCSGRQFIIKNITILKGLHFLNFIQKPSKMNLHKLLTLLEKSRSSLTFWQSPVYFSDAHITCVCLGISSCSNGQAGGTEEHPLWDLNTEKKETRGLMIMEHSLCFWRK